MPIYFIIDNSENFVIRMITHTVAHKSTSILQRHVFIQYLLEASYISSTSLSINCGWKTFHLIHFIVRPEISTSSAIGTLEGRDVILHCNVIAANPAANVTWRSPTGSEILSGNGTILLPSVNRRQHGEYICLASNGIGSVASKATYLTVNCKCYKLHIVYRRFTNL